MLCNIGYLLPLLGIYIIDETLNYSMKSKKQKYFVIFVCNKRALQPNYRVSLKNIGYGKFYKKCSKG